MTGKEIIQKLKEIIPDVSGFAMYNLEYGRFGDTRLLFKKIVDFKAQLHSEYSDRENKRLIELIPSEDRFKKVAALNEFGLGECITIVTRKNGTEWFTVKYFPEHDVYIKVTGVMNPMLDDYEVDFEDWDECCKEVKLDYLITEV